MVAAIVIGGAIAFALAYATYGRRLTRLFGLDAGDQTPAHALKDGVDYCPAAAPVLFGHHFCSIAGAGPIVGPIFASVLFGWLPAVI